MNELIIRKEKIDWLKIINLALKRKDWGKTHTMYTYGKMSITCVMKEFNFEEEIAWFNVKIIYFIGESNYKRSRTELVRYALKNFTIDDFKMHLNKKLISELSSIIRYEKTEIAEEKFEDLRFDRYDIEDHHIRDAGFGEDYDAIQELSDSIKDSALEKIYDEVDENLNEEFNDKVASYAATLEITISGVSNILEELEK